MKHSFLIALIGAWALAGCGGGRAAGTEGGGCYGNETCNAGLICLSQLCVVPPAGDGGIDATPPTDSATDARLPTDAVIDATPPIDGAADAAADGAPVDARMLTGCHGLTNCLSSCAQGDTACENDCVNNATARATTLFTQASLICPLTMFCGPGHPDDAGVVPCSSQDLDPANTLPLSASCQACYGTLNGSQARTACASDFLACTNDLP